MVDSSALAAIILEEPGWRQLAEQVIRASAFTTCFNVFEAALAVAGREKFGAGKRGLNLGDCLSYGAAKRNSARLLYVGEDFALTDINDSA